MDFDIDEHIRNVRANPFRVVYDAKTGSHVAAPAYHGGTPDTAKQKVARPPKRTPEPSTATSRRNATGPPPDSIGQALWDRRSAKLDSYRAAHSPPKPTRPAKAPRNAAPDPPAPRPKPAAAQVVEWTAGRLLSILDSSLAPSAEFQTLSQGRKFTCRQSTEKPGREYVVVLQSGRLVPLTRQAIYDLAKGILGGAAPANLVKDLESRYAVAMLATAWDQTTRK